MADNMMQTPLLWANRTKHDMHRHNCGCRPQTSRRQTDHETRHCVVRERSEELRQMDLRNSRHCAKAIPCCLAFGLHRIDDAKRAALEGYDSTDFPDYQRHKRTLSREIRENRNR